MFSGIVETVGNITEIVDHGGDRRIVVDINTASSNDLSIGDSVSINGACLTIVEKNKQRLSFDVSKETLNCTNLGALKSNGSINIEFALRLSDRINGHLVTGHVDTVGEIINKQEQMRSWQFDVKLASEYAKYISKKGSVAIDGVSLTVNEVNNNVFSVNIIPHTYEQTLFKHYSIGSNVNIEVDMIARYLESLLSEK